MQEHVYVLHVHPHYRKKYCVRIETCLDRSATCFVEEEREREIVYVQKRGCTLPRATWLDRYNVCDLWPTLIGKHKDQS